jgi:hypothetical protein
MSSSSVKASAIRRMMERNVKHARFDLALVT